MPDELPHQVSWRNSSTTDSQSNLMVGFYETLKKEPGDFVDSWTNLEDCRLLDHVSRRGENRWSLIGRRLGKSALQCSERYLKHLRPQILGSSKTYTTLLQRSVSPQSVLSLEQNSKWTKGEDSTLVQSCITHGSNWELIANRLTTNSSLRKKRTALDVRQRHEKVVPHHWPTYNKENCPLSSLRFRNSLLSWSNTSRNSLVNSGDQPLNKTSRPTYVIPLSSLKSNSDLTLNRNWKIRLTQSHDSGFSESGLSNNSQSGSNSYQSLKYSVVPTTSVSSINPLLSTSTPVDLIKNEPSISPDKHNFSLSSFMKSDSLRIPQSNTDDLISPSPSIHDDINECSTRLISPLDTNHQASSCNELLNGIMIDDNSHFIIQTPTKALSEADQLSFHLASPRLTPVRSRLPQSKSDDDVPPRRPPCTRLFDDTPKCSSSSVASTSTSSSFNENNNRPKRSFTNSSTLTTYNSCDEAKSIAIVTAKATAWNRALLRFSSSSTVTTSLLNSQRSNLSYLNMNNTNNRIKIDEAFSFDSHNLHTFPNSKDSMMEYYNNLSSYKSRHQVKNSINLDPLKPLQFSARKQPHLSLRRVVQVGNEL
ncbi:unnamed protein product [Heterobilharzia americana]|nr:unnamed protein product [Heterobilharzia americana]